MTRVKLTPALNAPVVDIVTAEAFMRELHRLQLGFHFDDGAIECLFENKLVTRRDAWQIDAQVSDCYAAWRQASRDPKIDCPIGFFLTLG